MTAFAGSPRSLLDLLEIEAWLVLAHHASTPALAAAYLERARRQRR